MYRKDFLKYGSLAFLGGCFSVKKAASSIASKRIFPKALQEGDTVALLAPGSQTSPENFNQGIKNLEKLGYKVKVMPNARAEKGYLAGTDAERLSDLHGAFSDSAVKAIWCLRGGYGCARFLDAVDYSLIQKNPKIFIGYSDITALHTGIHQKTGLVTFHGPMATSDFAQQVVTDLNAVIRSAETEHRLQVFSEDLILDKPVYRPEVIRGGTATGALIGGNLSLLSALCGTAFQPIFKDKIVFIEDIGEKPYRLDRMFTQLLQATDLKQAAGVALGVFEDCEAAADSRSLSLREMLDDRLGGLGIPVLYGLPFGHISEQATLPVGVKAELDTKTMVLLDKPPNYPDKITE